MPRLPQVLVAVLLVAAAAAGWYAFGRPDTVPFRQLFGAAPAPPPGGGGGPSAARRNTAPAPVIAAAVALDDGRDTLVALGTAEARRSIMLYPQAAGVVAETALRPGAAVSAGAVLLRLDAAEQEVEVERARLALDEAAAALDRAERLGRSRNIADVALAEARAAAARAAIDLKAAEIALARRGVTAPFAGTLGLAQVEVGDLVGSTTAIATLDDLSSVVVAFEVAERFAGRIADGAAIEATAAAAPGQAFAGTITAVDSRLDPATRTLRVEATLANDRQMLKPGMAVTVTLHFPGAPRPAVPSLAVQWDRAGAYVWAIDAGVARRRAVTVLARRSGLVVVDGDLAPDDRVVVEGVQRLRDGAPVRLIGEMPPPAGRPPAVAADDAAAGTRS